MDCSCSCWFVSLSLSLLRSKNINISSFVVELQYHLLKLRSTRQVESKYYCEINIFVTATPKEETSHLPLLRQSVVGVNSSSNIRPAFTAEELYGSMRSFPLDFYSHFDPL